MKPLGIGLHFERIGQEIHTYPTKEINYTWVRSGEESAEEDESITFQSSEGMTFNGDFGIRFRVDSSKVHVLYKRFRTSIDEIRNTFLRSIVRSSINEHAEDMDVERLYGRGKSEMVNRVLSDVRSEASDVGIEVFDIYIIGEFRLPGKIKAAIDNKIEMTQDAITQEAAIRKARAKAVADSVEAAGEARAKMIRAEAEADANREVAQSLTRELIQYERAKMWNGELPQFMGGSGTNFLLQP